VDRFDRPESKELAGLNGLVVKATEQSANSNNSVAIETKTVTSNE